MHMEPDGLPFARYVILTIKDLFLVDKYLLTLIGGNETIPLTWVKPFNCASLFKQRAAFQETSHTLDWDFDTYTSSLQKIMIGIGHHKTTPTSLTHNRLG